MKKPALIMLGAALIAFGTAMMVHGARAAQAPTPWIIIGLALQPTPEGIRFLPLIYNGSAESGPQQFSSEAECKKALNTDKHAQEVFDHVQKAVAEKGGAFFDVHCAHLPPPPKPVGADL